MKHLLLTQSFLFFALMQAGAQNIGIGVTEPMRKLHVNGHAMIDSSYVLELGGKVIKEVNAGKIGYETFTPGSLDIVGAGATAGNRKIKFFNEGGANFAGKLHMESGELTHNKTGVNSHLLPVGIAFVQATGTKQFGTTNITTSWVTDHYVIEMGESVQGMQPIVTVLANTPRFATVINGSTTAIWVYIWSTSGAKVQSGFNLAVYKP